MKIFTNKSIWKKIAIILVIVILFEFVVTRPVQADVIEGGGKLLTPIFSLLVTMGDGIMNILHSSIMNIDASLIEINTSDPWWSIVKDVIATIIVAACIIGAIVLTGGLATILAWTAVISVASTVLLGSNFIVALEDQAGQAVMSMFDEEALPSTLYLPSYSYSPEEIFKGNILLFNVNFFRDPITIQEKTKTDDEGNEVVSYYYYEDDNGDEIVTSRQDSAEILQKTISSWYNAIRNICLVLMLSVLVYIGIRMLLSSIASDKAKYQTMLKDWIVGLCLLFLMHYIMAFSVTIVEKLTDVVSASLDDKKYIAIIPYKDQIKEDLEELGMEEKLRVNPEDEEDGYAWPSNLMGYLRVKLQLNTNGWQYIGEAIMFLILTIFTVMFTFIYLKRLLYMAFLTLIAPVVSLTYCIDKLNDGQAQGFNKWIREYIFNLLIQPMHLLLYYILITSAFEMMGENIVYSIVAIGFMIPAEKLLRSLFGFEKSHTAPAIGPAGAMAASSVLSKMLHKGPSGGKGGNANSNSGDSGSEKVPKQVDNNPINPFLGNEESTAQQQMLDSYDDQYGTQDWDPQERDAMAREAYKGDGKSDTSYEEYLNIMKDNLGEDASEEELKQAVKDEWRIEEPTQPKEIKQKNNEQANNQQKRKIGLGRKLERKAYAFKAVGETAISNGVKDLPKRSIRMAGRIAGGTAVGALAGGAGIAIGAATGDFSNVVKMGAGSAVAGAALGSGAIENAHIKNEYRETYDEAYNSSKYKEDAMNDYIKRYLKDSKNRRYFEQKFDKKQAKEMVESGEIEQYLRNGITDKKEMAAMHKLKNEGIVDNTEQAIAISQLGSMIGGDPARMKDKDKKEWGSTIGNMAKKSGVKDTDKFVENRFNQISKLYEFKK